MDGVGWNWNFCPITNYHHLRIFSCINLFRALVSAMYNRTSPGLFHDSEKYHGFYFWRFSWAGVPTDDMYGATPQEQRYVDSPLHVLSACRLPRIQQLPAMMAHKYLITLVDTFFASPTR